MYSHIFSCNNNRCTHLIFIILDLLLCTKTTCASFLNYKSQLDITLKLNCFEIKLWTQETLNLNDKFFLLWWDLNSGPPDLQLTDLQLSSNPLFRSLCFSSSGLSAKIGWPKLIQLSPTSCKSSARVLITYQLVYGVGWLHPVFQFSLSHSMWLQCSIWCPVL